MKKIFILLLISFTPSLGSAQKARSRTSIEIYAYGFINPRQGFIKLQFAGGAHDKTTVIETLFKPTSILTVQRDTAGKEKTCFPSAKLKSEYDNIMKKVARKLSFRLKKDAILTFGILTSDEIEIEPYSTESKS